MQLTFSCGLIFGSSRLMLLASDVGVMIISEDDVDDGVGARGLVSDLDEVRAELEIECGNWPVNGSRPPRRRVSTSSALIFGIFTMIA